jgi:predicted transcriptional regulator
MKIKLYSALKLKTRLIGDLNRVNALIQRDNSRVVTPKESEKFEQVIALQKERDELKRKILIVKTAIAKANIGIYSFLAELEESKNDLQFFNSLKITSGDYITSYNEGKPIYTEYAANITQEIVDKNAIEIQNKINSLQDKVDEYNGSTFIEIEGI